MTAKEFVKTKFPRATVERQVQGRVKGLQEVYYIVRENRLSNMYISTGKSESNAWVNAKKLILEKEKQCQK